MVSPDNERTRLQAAELIKAGGVIAFRTDTFYGLGADPFNAKAVERIKELKGREGNKPILLLISNYEQLDRVMGARSAAFDLLAKELWPGPLTIIGSSAKDLPSGITAGGGTVGVRLPDDESVRDLVALCGGAMTATSANPSGLSPAETGKQVEDYFTDDIDLIIESGAVIATKPSTVVDATETVKIVREGAVSRSELERVLGQRL